MDEPAPEAVPDVMAALPDMLPALRRTAALGWALIVTDAAATSILASILWQVDENRPQLALIAVAVGAVLLPAIARFTQRRHEAQIMPMMAATAGLRYAPAGKGFQQTLPSRLMPRAGVRKSEDLISGSIGGRQVNFAEMHYETGGKSSRTLFRGIVMAFPNVAPMPAFFLAPDGETQGSFWTGTARIKVDDLIRIRGAMGGNGIAFGVWASSAEVARHPALEAVIDILTHLEHAVGSGARLYSATSNGEIVHVALNHRRDLFRIGGLFTTRAQLVEQIRQGYQDLTLPMVIAGKLLEAERRAAPAG